MSSILTNSYLIFFKYSISTQKSIIDAVNDIFSNTRDLIDHAKQLQLFIIWTIRQVHDFELVGKFAIVEPNVERRETNVSFAYISMICFHIICTEGIESHGCGEYRKSRVILDDEFRNFQGPSRSPQGKVFDRKTVNSEMRTAKTLFSTVKSQVKNDRLKPYRRELLVVFLVKRACISHFITQECYE